MAIRRDYVHIRLRRGKNQDINNNHTNISIIKQQQEQSIEKQDTNQKQNQTDIEAPSDIRPIKTQSSSHSAVISNENDFFRSLENQDEFKRLTGAGESLGTYFAQNFPSQSHLTIQKILNVNAIAQDQHHIASSNNTVNTVRLHKKRLHLKSGHHHPQRDDNSDINCLNDCDKKQELLLLNHQISTEVAQFLSYELSDLNQGLHQDDLLSKKLESINFNSNQQCHHSNDQLSSPKSISCFRCLQYGDSCKTIDTKNNQTKSKNLVIGAVASKNDKNSVIQSDACTSRSNKSPNKESIGTKKINQSNNALCSPQDQSRVNSVCDSKSLQNNRGGTLKTNKQLQIRNRRTAPNGGNSFTIRCCCCCCYRSVSFDKGDTNIDLGESVDLKNVDNNNSDKVNCDNQLTYQASGTFIS